MTWSRRVHFSFWQGVPPARSLPPGQTLYTYGVDPLHMDGSMLIKWVVERQERALGQKRNLEIFTFSFLWIGSQIVCLAGLGLFFLLARLVTPSLLSLYPPYAHECSNLKYSHPTWTNNTRGYRTQTIWRQSRKSSYLTFFIQGLTLSSYLYFLVV